MQRAWSPAPPQPTLPNVPIPVALPNHLGLCLTLGAPPSPAPKEPPVPTVTQQEEGLNRETGLSQKVPGFFTIGCKWFGVPTTDHCAGGYTPVLDCQHTVFGYCSSGSSQPSMVSDPYRPPSLLVLDKEGLTFTASKGGDQSIQSVYTASTVIWILRKSVAGVASP